MKYLLALLFCLWLAQPKKDMAYVLSELREENKASKLRLAAMQAALVRLNSDMVKLGLEGRK